MRNAEYYIRELNMESHVEGGYFKETYRSAMQIDAEGFGGVRNVCTAIYFLLESKDFSAFHKIKSDELWHFYDGDPLSIYVIHPSGELEIMLLGLDVGAGQLPQLTVTAGCWFGSRVLSPGKYSLVGCTVSPGFDFEDFELASQGELTGTYPQHVQIINEMTRQ